MLTMKQEKFVQNLIKGMSQRQAYKKSFDAKKMKNETIDSKASELFHKDEVRERYDELRQKAEAKAIMSAIDRKIFLSKVIQGKQKEDVYITVDNKQKKVGKRTPDLATKLRSLDLLNKMDGQYTENLNLAATDDTFKVNIKVVK